ncbi:MAG: hypothetical protein RL748_4456 [Pseudomonadota bacterium]
MKPAFPLLSLLLLLPVGSSAATTTSSPASLPSSASPTSASSADDLSERVAACSACHGKQGRAASDGYYPRIAGKPAGYLFNQLQNFRQGRRQYPMMTYMVQHLSDAYLQEIAAYYANQHLPYPPPQPAQVTQAILQRGQALVQKGDAARQIPACIACHGQQLTGMAPAIPGLLGLPGDYLSAQFGAWKRGARRAAEPDCMAQITQRLTLDDIQATSAWLAQQVPPADARAPALGAHKLPIACGSVKEQP